MNNSIVILGKLILIFILIIILEFNACGQTEVANAYCIYNMGIVAGASGTPCNPTTMVCEEFSIIGGSIISNFTAPTVITGNVPSIQFQYQNCLQNSSPNYYLNFPSFVNGTYTYTSGTGLCNIQVTYYVDAPISLVAETTGNRDVNSNINISYDVFNVGGNTPTFQYKIGTSGEWTSLTSKTFSATGGNININPRTELNFPSSNYFNTPVYFRVKKLLKDGLTTTYGTTLGPLYFFDQVILGISPSVGLVCETDNINFSNWLKNDLGDPKIEINGLLEARYAKATNPLWYQLDPITCHLSIPYTSISYLDLNKALGSDCRGEEIRIRSFHVNPIGTRINSPIKSIVFLPTPNIKVNSYQPTCHGSNNARITVIPIGYKLSGAPNPDTLNATIPLIVNIKYYSTINIGSNEKIEFPSGSGTFYYYNNGATRIITTAIGDSLVINNQTFTNFTLSSGIYSVSAWFNRSEANCPKPYTFQISDPAQFTVAATYSLTNNGYHIRSCDNFGSLNLTVANGIKPYSFYKTVDNSLIDTTLDNIIEKLPSGKYYIYIKDGNNCQAELTIGSLILSQVNFTKPPTLSISVNQNNVINIGCKGDSTGSIPFTVSGGIGNKVYAISPYSYKIINGSPASGLKNGTYSITVTDAVNCQSTQSNIIINEPVQKLTINKINYNAPSCYGIADGSINTIDATGGTGTNYLYSLNGNNPWISIKNSSIGMAGDLDLIVHVKDQNNCLTQLAGKIPSSPIDISTPTLLSSITDASCATASNGIVSINPSGGTPFTDGYDILINGVDTKNTRTLNYSNINLPIGKYSVSIIDSKGCSPSVIPNVTIGVVANPLSITNVSVINAASCSMVSDGSALISINSGVRPFPNYSYYVNNVLQGTATASENLTINNLSPANQTFKVIDNAGCIATYDQIIGVINNSLSLSANNSIDAHCKDNPGSITLNRSNGTTNFNYTIFNEDGSTYSNFTNSLNSFSVDLPFGLYNFKVQDNNNCEAVSSGEIVVSPKHLDLNEPLTVSSVCDGSPTGKISVTKIVGTGFMPDVKYFLNGTIQSNNGVYDNLIPGDYTISAIDNENCISPLKIVSVGYNANPVTISSELIDQSCAIVNNGRIIVNSASTQNGKTFNIIKIKNLNLNDSILNSSVDTFKSLPAGTYHIMTLDENRCSTIKDLVINNGHFSPKPLLDKTTEVACKNATNGTLSVFSSKNKSVPSYKYYLDYNNTKAYPASDSTVRITFKDLSRGLHNVSITDNLGCSDSAKFLVGIHTDSLRLSPVNSTPATCILAKNGYATVAASSFDHISNAKKYKFKCNGQNLWGESVIFTNLGVNKTGWTNVMVSDTFGCIDTSHFVVNVQADTLNLAFNYLVNAACPGSIDGHINLIRTNGNNGFKYNITKSINSTDSIFYENSSNVDIAKLPFGNYKVSVQDTSGCKASINNLSINQPDTIKFYSFTNNYIKHKGLPEGVITTNLQSGNNKYIYEWQNIKDNSILQTGKTQVNTGISLINLSAGDYLFRAQDTARCFVTPNGWLEKKFHIAEPDSNLKIYLAHNNPVTCFGLTNGDVKIKATGGWGSDYTYGKDATNLYQSNLFDNLKADDYIFYAKDTSGVIVSLPVTVIQPDILTADLKSYKDANCYGTSDGIVKTTIHGGNFPFYSISTDNTHWTKGDSITTLSKGTYLISIRDTFGCSYDIPNSININEPTQITAIDTLIQKSKCGYANGSITSNCSGGIPAYSYEWHNETGDLLTGNKNNEQNLFSGSYFLKVTDTHNCPYQFHFNVSDITDLTIDRIDTTNVSCWGYSNGGAKISVSKGNPPYSILWPDKSTNTSVSGLKSDSYIVRVDDQEKCKLFNDFYIGTPDSIGIESTTRTNPLCEGRSDGSLGITPIGGFGNYQYQWENGKKTNPRLNLIAGKYTVLVTDGHKCFNTFSYNLQYQQTIKPSLGNDINLCLENKYILSPGTYSDYKWTSNVGITSADSTLTVSQQGKYYVEVKDNDGCIGRDSVTFGQSQTNLTGKLLVASNVQVRDTVMIFEASWPLPDSALFHLPGCNIISSGKYFREVIYSDTGKFAINLTSYLNDCLDYVTKDIQVEPRGNTNNSKSGSSRLIQSYAVSPNPSDGHINVEIHLRESAPIVMKLANLGTGITNNVRELKGSDIYLTSYNFSNLPSGLYLLYIQAGNETQTKTLIIQK